MRGFTLSLLMLTALPLNAAPNPELAYQLKASVVKVHVITKTGGHGVGTGVIVGKDLVATNCHVLANANGVNITKFGDSFSPVALKADWAHDLCILRFEFLDLNPVVLGDSDALQYEQEIFSIGFPGGPPKPQTTHGKIKALYPFQDANIIRTDASFVMGASGSPLFDVNGKLVGISTFKSPGREAYFYNIPVKWVKALLEVTEVKSLKTEISPFWDTPLEARPFFMQVVIPYQNSDWVGLQQVATNWVRQEPNTAEAHYYLGLSHLNQGRENEAHQALKRALEIQTQHTASLIVLGLMANKSGNTAEVARVHEALKAIQIEADDEFSTRLKGETH